MGVRASKSRDNWLVFGLDGAGKSTIVRNFETDEVLDTPTSGLGITSTDLEYKNSKLRMHDIGWDFHKYDLYDPSNATKLNPQKTKIFESKSAEQIEEDMKRLHECYQQHDTQNIVDDVTDVAIVIDASDQARWKPTPSNDDSDDEPHDRHLSSDAIAAAKELEFLTQLEDVDDHEEEDRYVPPKRRTSVQKVQESDQQLNTQHIFQDVTGIVFVIDATDTARLKYVQIDDTESQARYSSDVDVDAAADELADEPAIQNKSDDEEKTRYVPRKRRKLVNAYCRVSERTYELTIPSEVIGICLRYCSNGVFVKDLVEELLQMNELKDALWLFWFNKYDLPAARFSVEQMIEFLDLKQMMKGRKWAYQAACALTGEGLYEGLDIIRNLQEQYYGLVGPHITGNWIDVATD